MKVIGGWRLAVRPGSREQSGASAHSLQPTALARAAAIGALLLSLSACGNIEPWVKPYERQALADPIMSFGANPVSSAYIDHVHDAREGARGATGGGGGGCGCN